MSGVGRYGFNISCLPLKLHYEIMLCLMSPSSPNGDNYSIYLLAYYDYIR